MTRRLAPFAAFAVLSALAQAHAVHAQSVTAFTGVTLIDGTDRAPITNATLVVRDGRVVAAGPAARIAIPNGAQRVVLTGKVIMPGLINSHGHANSVVELTTVPVVLVEQTSLFADSLVLAGPLRAERP